MSKEQTNNFLNRLLEQAEGETSTSTITQPEKESFKTQLTQSLSSVLPQRGKQ